MGTEPHVPASSIFLDTANQCLRRQGKSISLTPKAFAVLCRLMEEPGRLVTKEDLLNAAWPGTYVSDAALKVCISRLRQALGDLSHPPRYIETVHWRGYRLLTPIPTTTSSEQSSEQGNLGAETLSPVPTQHATPNLSLPTPNAQHPTPSLVGREMELQILRQALATARNGERRTIFISGASGIGKTTVIEAFLAEVDQDSAVTVARGQCMEHYGLGESYLPVIDAFSRLCRASRGERIVSALRNHAPVWLSQFPSLLSADKRKQIRQELYSSSRERMLREIAETMEALATEQPFILVLEDLHWSDHATLDLLSFLARRLEPAQLLIVGAYRPEELASANHPLKNIKYTLQARQRCDELILLPFTMETVEAYLLKRFPEHDFPSAFAAMLQKRTGGSPLFLVNMLDHLTKQGFIAFTGQAWLLTGAIEDIQTETPENVHQTISAQIDRLAPEEKFILEAASVAGMEFSAAAAASGLGADIVEVETYCEELMRRGQFLRALPPEEWPDGTVTASYAFLHSLYQQVWYARVTAARRVQLHRRIGERFEQAYHDQVHEVAAELAVHFERGRDIPRAILYSQSAAENAAHRFGYHEAIFHLTKGVELLASQPPSPDQLRQEIALQNALGAARTAVLGYAAPEVEEAYLRARNLSWQIKETQESVPALRGLWAFYLTKGESQPAYALAMQLLQIAQQERSRDLELEAERELGQTYYFFGKLREARQHLERGLSLYDAHQHASHIFLYGQDPGVVCLAQYARTLVLLGYPEHALKQSQAAIALAREVQHPYSLVLAHYHAAVVHFARRDWRRAGDFVKATMALSTEHGFPYWFSSAQVLNGWLLTRQGHMEKGIECMQQGLASYEATGAELNRPYSLLFLAEACAMAGDPEQGLTLIAKALATAKKNGGHFRQAEMLRLRGEFTLQKAGLKGWSVGMSLPPPRLPLPQSQVPDEAAREAEQCFQQAIALAQQQGAKLLELRAVTSLCRLQQQQTTHTQEQRQLAEIVGWFTEGFDLPDWQEAKTILDELGE